MAKKTSLVSQYLENISRRALEKYQDIIRGYARRRPGVYALYRRGKLYYVGLASNLRARLKMHLRDRHSGSWDRFSLAAPGPVTVVLKPTRKPGAAVMNLAQVRLVLK